MGLNKELDGFLVVALEQAVAAPYCSLLLADAGARVIKLERPEGDFCRNYDRAADGQSTWFGWLNRGKQSVVVDYAKDEDAALLRALIAQADVFLHNLSPNALARNGFSAQDLRALNPRLINLQITGYGTEGEAAEMKAYDFLVQAESGLCAVTGTAEHPARVGVSICDIATGLTGFSAILRALLQRSRTGVGVDLEISMFDVLADWMNMPLLAHRYWPAKPERMGLTHSLLSPYGAYSCKGGDQILIAIQNNREWTDFCAEVLQRPELGPDPRFVDNAARVANRDAVDAEIDRVFSTLTREAVADKLQAARIAWSRLSSLEDLSQHPFLRKAEAMFGGSVIELVDLPVKTDGPRPVMVPQLGQHTRAVRQEFLS
jgi:itaconate CoA-transferase